MVVYLLFLILITCSSIFVSCLKGSKRSSDEDDAPYSRVLDKSEAMPPSSEMAASERLDSSRPQEGQSRSRYQKSITKSKVEIKEQNEMSTNKTTEKSAPNSSDMASVQVNPKDLELYYFGKENKKCEDISRSENPSTSVMKSVVEDVSKENESSSMMSVVKENASKCERLDNQNISKEDKSVVSTVKKEEVEESKSIQRLVDDPVETKKKISFDFDDFESNENEGINANRSSQISMLAGVEEESSEQKSRIISSKSVSIKSSREDTDSSMSLVKSSNKSKCAQEDMEDSIKEVSKSSTSEKEKKLVE